MKKISPALLVITLSVLVASCETVSPDVEQVVQNVYQYPGITQQEIYNRALVFVTRAYASPNEVIQMQNEADGIIICRGADTVTALGGFMRRHYLYTMTIEAREERIRITIDQFTALPAGNSPGPNPQVVENWNQMQANANALSQTVADAVQTPVLNEDW